LRNERTDALVIVCSRPVDSKAQRVEHRGAENVVQFDDACLVACGAANQFSVETVRRGEPRIVEVIRREQAVAFRKPMVETGCDKVFVRYLLPGEREYAGIAPS